MSRRILLFPILLANLLLSCGGQKTAAAPPKPEEEALVVPADRTADDVARYLAGVPAKPGSKLADLHETPGHKAHSKDFDLKFAKFEQGRRGAMEKFQKWHGEHEIQVRKRQETDAKDRRVRRSGPPVRRTRDES